jgi:hypothetical protein
MSSKMAVALALALALAPAAGCMHSNVDKHWGEAYRESIARMTDDSEAAARNAEEPAPTGLDGATAEGTLGRYRQSQRGTPAPQLPMPMIVTNTESLGSR